MNVLNRNLMKPKKMVRQFVLALAGVMTAGMARAQLVANDSKQEEKIRSLISQMTLAEKVSLMHGNSKFYVSGIKRLGIPEWALSDGPHVVRAGINTHHQG